MLKSKLKASLIHLVLSILLVGLVIGSILFFWFPQMFINITDFKEVAMIIITVDLVLGPLLTFVVFKPEKKSLKFDLSVIGAIQLAALIYGAHALYQIHPVYVTFNVDRFTIVTARDSAPEKAKYDEYKVSKLTTAKLAFAKLPDDSDKRLEIIISAANGGTDVESHAEYYEPYANNINYILSKGLDPKIIFSNEKSNETIGNFIKKHNDRINEFVYLPINSPNKDAIIVLDKKTAQPVTTINIDPWEITEK